MSRRAAFVIPALYLATVAAFADMYVTQPLLPQLAHDFGVSAAMAGLTISALVLTTALTSSGYGPLSDVLGRRSLMVWGSVLLALATFACSFAPSFGWLVALRALQGVLLPAISALAIAYIHDDLGGGDAATVVGGYIAASVTGGLAGRVGSGLLADAFGWRSTFGVFAALTLVGALALAVTIAPAPRRPQRVGFLRDLASSYREMALHVRDRRLVGAFLIGAALFFGFIGFFTYLPFYLTAAPFSLSTGAVAWLYLPYIAGVIVSPIAGRLTRRYSLRALMAAGVSLALLAILASLIHDLRAIVVASVVLCGGMFLAQPLAPTFVARNASGGRGGATALYQSFYYLGAVFGSVVPGLAWERCGWNGVVATCAASLIVALLADWLLCGGRRADQCSPLVRVRNSATAISAMPTAR